MVTLDELKKEMKVVFNKKTNVSDTILLPLLFIVLDSIFDLHIAVITAVVLVFALVVYRVYKKQRLFYTITGAVGTLLAVAIAYYTGKAESFYIPNVVRGFMIAIIALISVLVNRPLVAFTSLFARRWPQGWYWHKKVAPAYREVTILWAVFYGFRSAFTYLFIVQENTQLVVLINIIMGWPGLITLLVISYIYGIWRLRNLRGPSVDEFIAKSPPPWKGQIRGF